MKDRHSITIVKFPSWTTYLTMHSISVHMFRSLSASGPPVRRVQSEAPGILPGTCSAGLFEGAN